MLKKLKALLTLAVVCATIPSAQVRAEDPIDEDVLIVGWVDHFTFGLPNTAIGLLMIPYTAIDAAVSGRRMSIEIDASGQQIALNGMSGCCASAFSLGAFNHGGRHDFHEAGHSRQSAVLGPLYLGVVGLDYLINGHYGSFLERWADDWAHLDQSMREGNPVDLTLEVRTDNGTQTIRFGTSVVLLEQSSRRFIRRRGGRDRGAPAMTSWRYGRIRAEGSVGFGENGGDPNFAFGASLFERDFEIVYPIADHILGIRVDSQQRTLDFSYDPALSRADLDIISQDYGVGMRVGDPQVLALDVTGRAGMELQQRWHLSGGILGLSETPAMGFNVLGRVAAEARIMVMNVVEVFGRVVREWSTDGSRREEEAVGIGTPQIFQSHVETARDRNAGRVRTFDLDHSFISRRTQEGGPVPVRVRAEYIREREYLGSGDPDSAAGPSLESERFEISIGGRF
jgi:hypothetical protein